MVYYASVPRLTEEYIETRGAITNGVAAPPGAEEPGAYVMDKGYFANMAAVKSAPNLDLLGPKPVEFEAGDKLIELRTVILLIRK